MEANAQEISFEEALRRLETIVAKLESGRGELEESLGQYEEGIRLLRRCRQILDGAERRVEILKGLDADGAPILDRVDENALRSQTDVAGRQSASANSLKKSAKSPENIESEKASTETNERKTRTSASSRRAKKNDANAPSEGEKTSERAAAPSRGRSFFDEAEGLPF